MKLKLYTYVHEENGIALQVIPETEPEQVLLDALWRFGRLDIVHTCNNSVSTGFIVKAFQDAGTEQATATEKGS